MKNLFHVQILNTFNRVGNLIIPSNNKEHSKKVFPIFQMEDKFYLFKALSKTKPLLTPFFAFSEVYWSYIIHFYFDKKTPCYTLASFSDMSIENPTYSTKGVLVENLSSPNKKIISLYDYFIEHPEKGVNIKNYANSCMAFYDYTFVLNSNFIKEHARIGEGLAFQILLSVLRQDQNFHYGNINLFCENDTISLVPSLDFEYSTPFLFLDNEERNHLEQDQYRALLFPEENNPTRQDLQNWNSVSKLTILSTNICFIIKKYPFIVLNFIKKLDFYLKAIPSIEFNDPNSFIGLINSDYWKVGCALFKNHNEEGAKSLAASFPLRQIDKEKTFQRIQEQLFSFGRDFSILLKMYLFSFCNGIEDLESLTFEKFYKTFGFIHRENIRIDEDMIRNILKKK